MSVIRIYLYRSRHDPGGLDACLVAADELCEAASGDAAVAKSGTAVYQPNRRLRFYDRFAIERSLVPAATPKGEACVFKNQP